MIWLKIMCFWFKEMTLSWEYHIMLVISAFHHEIISNKQICKIMELVVKVKFDILHRTRVSLQNSNRIKPNLKKNKTKNFEKNLPPYVIRWKTWIKTLRSQNLKEAERFFWKELLWIIESNMIWNFTDFNNWENH